jgi:hypothetical protein
LMYVIPTFNLLANIWHDPHIPMIDPPDLQVACNLSWGKRTQIVPTQLVAVLEATGQILLLLPATTDIRDSAGGTRPDVTEVPAGSGRTYICTFVDDIGKGFANEHRAAIMVKFGVWPIPYP